MSTSPSVTRSAPGHPATAGDILSVLVADGTLAPAQADSVLRALEPVLGQVEEPRRLGVRAAVRRHAAEVAGYVGAVFVGLSAVVFLAQSWDEVGQLVRTLLLAAVAAVAGVVGALVARGRSPSLAEESNEARRRVSGTLLAACAAVTSLTVAAALEAGTGGLDSRRVVLVPLAGLVVATVGYAVAPTALGHLAVLAAALGTLLSTGPLLDLDTLTLGGVALLVLGTAWFVLVYRGVLREPVLGYALAGLVAVLGAQMVGVLSGEDPSMALRLASYLLTAGVAAALLVAYATVAAWPLLATGVLAASIAVIEVLNEWFGDTLGVPGMLLASGLVLLVASVIGLRVGRRGAT